MNKKIKEYIEKALSKGYDKKTIQTLLQSENWDEKEIDEALNSLKVEKIRPKESFFLFLYFAGIWLLLFVIFPFLTLIIFEITNLREIARYSAFLIMLGAHISFSLKEFVSYLIALFIPIPIITSISFFSVTAIYIFLFTILRNHLSSKKSKITILGIAILYYLFFLFAPIGEISESVVFVTFLSPIVIIISIISVFVGIFLGEAVHHYYLFYKKLNNKKKRNVAILIPTVISIFIFLLLVFIYTHIQKEKSSQELAGTATSIELCKTIKKYEYKKECFYNVGLLNKDFSVCDHLSPERESCLSDTDFCKSFPTGIESCYYYLSTKLKDSTNCSLIDTPTTKFLCYIDSNPEELTVPLCKEISKGVYESRKYSCFYNIALSNKDFTVCDYLLMENNIGGYKPESVPFDKSREGCYYNLSRRLEDSTGCFLITNNIRKKFSCLLLVAPEKLNKSICDELKEYEIETKTSFMPNSNHCYYKVKEHE